MIADMTRAERIAWFNFHIDTIATALANAETVIENLGRLLERSDAFEHPSMNAQRFRESVMERVNSKLAQEVQEHLGV